MLLATIATANGPALGRTPSSSPIGSQAEARLGPATAPAAVASRTTLMAVARAFMGARSVAANRARRLEVLPSPKAAMPRHSSAKFSTPAERTTTAAPAAPMRWPAASPGRRPDRAIH